MGKGMKQLQSVVLAIGLVIAGSSQWTLARADETSHPATAPAAVAQGSEDVASLAARIDELIAKRWKAEKATPAPPADDDAFIRRVSLDIAGKIPSVAELHEFLDDPSPDKRQRLVERLLDSPAYIRHFSNVWRMVMLPEAESNLEVRILIPGFEAWLRKQLAANTAYDALVR